MGFNQVSYVEIALVWPVIYGTVIGVLIGMDRELRGKSAGIGTNVLICVGAIIFTQLSLLMDPATPSRIASNIVTGIGFIGAGLILKRNQGGVSGLTTAASIWTTAGIGMAIGFGYFFLAAVVAIISIVAPRIPNFGPHLTTEESVRMVKPSKRKR